MPNFRGSRKRQHSGPSQPTDIAQPRSKKQRLCCVDEPPSSVAFWDNLSKVWLTKRALSELDRRNAQIISGASHRAQPHTRQPVTRGLIKSIERLQSVQTIHNKPRCCEPPSKKIKLFARHTLREAVGKTLMEGVGRKEASPLEEIDTASRRVRTTPVPYREDAYRQLYLYAMRYILELHPRRPKQVSTPSSGTLQTSPSLWHGFASLAHDLGFRSAAIDEIRRQDPDRETARGTLMAGRSVTDLDSDSMETAIHAMAKILSAARRQPDQTSSPVFVVHDGPGEEHDDRCGWITEGAYRSAQPFLSADCLKQQVSGTGGITPLLVRKFVFDAFFGDLSQARQAAPLPTVVTPQGSTERVRPESDNRSESELELEQRQESEQANTKRQNTGHHEDPQKRNKTMHTIPPTVVSQRFSSDLLQRVAKSREFRRRGTNARATQMASFGDPANDQPGVDVLMWRDHGWTLLGGQCTQQQVEHIVDEAFSTNPSLLTYDSSGRGMAQEECFQVALQSPSQAVYLAPRQSTAIFSNDDIL